MDSDDSSKDSSAAKSEGVFLPLGRPGFFFDWAVSDGTGTSTVRPAGRSSGTLAECSVPADRAWLGRALMGGSLKTGLSSRLSEDIFLLRVSAVGSGKTGVKVKSLPGVRGTPALRTGDCAG